MKIKTRLLAVFLVLVMLLPMIVACDEITLLNKPEPEKESTSTELDRVPETQVKLDAKQLLLDLLRQSKVDATVAQVSAKFKGDITVSFLDPKVSYSTADIPSADDDGYVDVELDYLLSRLDDTKFGDFEGAAYQVLFDAILGGGYGDLEEMLNGVLDSVTPENVFAEYGSAENYAAAMGATALVAMLSVASEEQAHKNDTDGIPESCMSYIEDNITYSMELFKQILNGNDAGENFEAVLVELTEGGYLKLLASGCINANTDEYMYSYEMLYMVCEEMLDYIYEQRQEYAENDYTLYYDAMKEEISTLIMFSMSTYIVDYQIFDNEYFHAYLDCVAAEVDKYLASENGPIMRGEFEKLPFVFAAAALTLDTVNMMSMEITPSATSYAYFDLNTEKWYDIYGDEIVPDEGEKIIPIDSVLGYAANIGDEPEAFANVAGRQVYAVYEITVDVDYVSEENLFPYLTEKVFAIYTSALDTVEVTKENALMLTTAGLAYTFAFPQTNIDFDLGVDFEFATRYALSVIGYENPETTEAILRELGDKYAYRFGATADEFVELWMASFIPEGETADDLTEEMLYRVANILSAMNTRVFDERYDYTDFGKELALFIYLKYLCEEDTGLGELNGLPFTIAATLLDVFAYEKLGYPQYMVRSIVCEYYKGGYYQGSLDNYAPGEVEYLIYYEDMAAIMLMLVVDDPEIIFEYAYPFDYVEHQLITATVYNFLSERAQYDDSSDIFNREMEAVAALLYDIFTVDNLGYDRFLVAADVVLVALNAYRNENDDFINIMYEYAAYLEKKCKEEEIDYTSEDCTMGDIFGMMISSLADEVDTDLTVLRAIIDVANGTDDEEYNAALEASIFAVIFGFDPESPEAVGKVLCDLGTILDAPFFAELGAAIAAIELAPDDDAIEMMLDATMVQIFGSIEDTGVDYTVLTDVILAYIEKADPTDALNAAKAELAEDYELLAFLRAIAGDEQAADDVILANLFTILYTCSAEATIAYAVPAVYLSEAEFTALCEKLGVGEAVRAWASEYLALLINDVEGDVDVLEAAVELLIADGYFDGLDELPEETDEDYYDILAAIYLADMYFGDIDYARAVVALLFGDDIAPYAATYLEMANSFEVVDTQTHALYLALNVVSTKAHLDITGEAANEIDWEAVLAYIPELYEGVAERPLEIANYKAFSELLRPAFAEQVISAVTATVVPYDTASEVILVFTVKGDLDHSVVDGEFEMVIEIVVPKYAIEDYEIL